MTRTARWSRLASLPARSMLGPGPTSPASRSYPNDQDGDGLFEDVNGNGRKDFNDVIVYFNHMTCIAAFEDWQYFNFNGNGRIDFADIILIFNHL